MKRLLPALALTLLAITASADELTLTNGDKLTGTVDKLVGGKLTFKSALAGVITVDAGNIRSLTTDAPVKVVLSDNSTAEQKLQAGGEKQFVIQINGANRELSFSQLLAINPPPPPAVKWEGNASLGLNIFHTNVNSRNTSLAVSLKRIGSSRIYLDAGLFNATQSGTTTEESYFLNGDYNYTVNKKLYGYYNGRLRRDRVQKLDLRTIFGAGLGYRFIDTPNFSLGLQGGLSWISESFQNTRGKSDITSQFGYTLDAKLGKSATFHHDFTIFPKFSDFGNNYFLAQFGLQQALSSSLFFDIRYIVDYTSRPGVGVTRSTNKLLFGIGKSF